MALLDPRPACRAAAAHDRLSSDQPLVAPLPEGKALPTKDDPALALVLVPFEGADTAGPESESDDAWVFPFDKPLLPEAGDNQALAVATTDGSVRYDVAFALVWAEGSDVRNVNEAHAYASCTDCVAVAVAFQVVLIMVDAHVVPQNLAVAANYDCYRCITAAVANQLVLSVQGEPGEAELRELAAVWDRLIEFAHDHELLTHADRRGARGVQVRDRRHPRGGACDRARVDCIHHTRPHLQSGRQRLARAAREHDHLAGAVAIRRGHDPSIVSDR